MQFVTVIDSCSQKKINDEILKQFDQGWSVGSITTSFKVGFSGVQHPVTILLFEKES